MDNIYPAPASAAASLSRPRPAPPPALPMARLPALLLALLLGSGAARAGSDVLVDLLAIPGSAGLGAIQRINATPYRGAQPNYDLVPLYLYEGRRVYLHASRAGLKLTEHSRHNLDAILDYRFEGHPFEQRPPILAGMEQRKPSLDAGLAYHYRDGLGSVDAEWLHDVNGVSNGSEWRLSYHMDWQAGRLHLRPTVTLARRDAKLNNYYYGVRALEATASRPAYLPGAGSERGLALYGYYELSERWRVLGGLGVTLADAKVRRSPIVDERAQPFALTGLAYDFGSHQGYSAPGLPLHMKLLGGRATECNFLPVVTLRCGSTRSQDDTRVWGVELGRPLVERVNGWPLDFIAWVGLLRHDERALVPGAWQVNADIKAYLYGLPWRQRLRTRIGMGAGFALAERVPLTEVRDQARRGRQTSKLLNYLDPTIDVSVGDLLGAPRWKDSYIGLGVSHRSGIFGSAQILGNINGGSNYLYAYLEAKL